MNKLALGMALPFLLSTTVALADGGYYIAANASNVKHEEFDDETGYSVAVGKYISNRVSVELGYTDLGTIDATTANGSTDVDVSAIQLSAVGYLPLGTKGGVFGRVGAEQVKIDGSVTLTGNPTIVGSDDETGAFFGIGGYYNITNNLDFRVELQRHDVIGLDTDTVNAGITFSTF